MSSVSSLIGNAQTYASGVLGDAQSALDDASSMVQSVGFSVPNFYPVALPDAPSAVGNLTAPSLSPIGLQLPSEPAGPDAFQDIPAIVAGDAPTLEAVAPTISLATKPNQLAAFNASAPSVNTSFSFPAPPSVLMNPLISEPVLIDRVAPAAPQVSLPVFGAIAPADNTVAPTNLEGKMGAAYAGIAPSMIALIGGHVDAMLTRNNPRFHEQMGRIESQLAKYLDGGTGLKPAIEDAIYARSRSKQDAESRRARDTAYSEAASRGFTMPTGALLSAVQQSRQAAADNNATAAREIVVMQAEMEQKNLQFAVTTSAGLRSTMLSATLSYMQNLTSINGQAMDYAKSILGAIIETYNTAVKAYSLKLEAYKTEATVYETRLKSAMAGIELYTIEIKALEALTNVDRAKVDVYRARIDSLRAYADVYKSQIDAVLGRASLEKLKLDLFQSQVQAYTAQVQGKNAEWQGYTAALGGENAKVQLFRAQVDAYGSELQGFKAKIDAQSEVVRAAAITNDAKARQYTATLSGYSAVVSARGEVARTQIESQRQEIIAFQAQSQAAVANAQVQNEYYRSVSMVGISNAELQMKAMIQDGANRQAFGASIASLGVSSAKIYADLASASMSGMNSLVANIQNE